MLPRNVLLLGKMGSISDADPVRVILRGSTDITQGKAFDLANKLLSTRLELSRQYILGQGLHLFGNANMETVDASITVDCSYVYMLVHYGLIYFIFFCVLLEAAVVYCWKRQKMDAVAILMVCAISGVTEQYMANTSFKNVAILFIAVMFYDNPVWRSKEGEHADGVVDYSLKLKLLEHVTARLAVGCGKLSEYTTFAVERILNHFCDNKKKVWLVSLGVFIIGVSIYCSTVHMPSSVYASLWDCDRKEGKAGYEYIYDSDLLNNPEFDGWILSDRDAQGRLYEFEGLTVVTEYYRRAAGRGFALVILVLWIESAVAVLNTRIENKNGQQ